MNIIATTRNPSQPFATSHSKRFISEICHSAVKCSFSVKKPNAVTMQICLPNKENPAKCESGASGLQRCQGKQAFMQASATYSTVWDSNMLPALDIEILYYIMTYNDYKIINNNVHQCDSVYSKSRPDWQEPASAWQCLVRGLCAIRLRMIACFVALVSLWRSGLITITKT